MIIPDYDEQPEQWEGRTAVGGGAGDGVPQVRGDNRGSSYEGRGRLLARVSLYLLRLWHQTQGHKGASFVSV